MVPVQSSDIRAVDYCDGVLTVSFHNGGLYQYTGVPRHVFDGPLSAPSKGRYLAVWVSVSTGKLTVFRAWMNFCRDFVPCIHQTTSSVGTSHLSMSRLGDIHLKRSACFDCFI